MTTTSPAVPAKLEGDLAWPNTVSARWVDPSGQVRSLSQVGLVYVPYLVGNEGDDRRYVRISDVTSINVDCEKLYETGKWPDATPVSELHVVAHWRRAPWGELIRLRPE